MLAKIYAKVPIAPLFHWRNCVSKGKTTEKKIFNQTDAADYLGISRRTLYSWRRKGFGPDFYKTPTGSLVTTKRSCDQFLANPG